MAVAQRRKLPVIEDAAQAFGSPDVARTGTGPMFVRAIRAEPILPFERSTSAEDRFLSVLGAGAIGACQEGTKPPIAIAGMPRLIGTLAYVG